MKVEQFQKELLKMIDDAVAKFGSVIPDIERNTLSRLQLLIKDLDIRNGVVLNNVKNLKTIGKLSAEIKKAVVSPKYVAAVQEFVNVFNTVAELQMKYFNTNFEMKPGKERLDLIQKNAKDALVQRLLGTGLDSGIVSEVEDILRRNITTGGSYNQLATQLQEYMVSSNPEKNPGRIAAYAKTITIDSVNQFSAQYNDTITEDLGLDWFMYVGSNLETTREFCEHLTKKRYVHKSELPAIVKGDIDNHQVKINPKTKLWYGAIEGTNTANFKVNRGGYRCGHQFFAVSKVVVPANIRAKFDK
jgi:hypothetical protein